MNNYEDIEFVVYSETKDAFKSMLASGEIDITQIGLIGDTGEVWINGEYYPFGITSTALSNLQTTLKLRFNIQSQLNNATIYSIYQGGINNEARLDILVPKVTAAAGSFITVTPKKSSIDLDNNETEEVDSSFELSPMTQSIANATESNDGLATANDVREALEDYVKKGDSVDVSIANDLTGVLQATEEQFVYRASAGANKSIRDESAVIRKIKGSSVVWEQRLQSIPTREDYDGVTTTYDSITNECIIRNISRTSNYLSGSTRWQIKPDLYTTVGHKYLIASNKHYSGIGVFVNNTFYECDRIFTATASAIIYFRIDKTFDFASSCPVGSELRIRLNCFDLTEMFGEGKEPNTIEEFRELFPLSYYDYAEPMIKGMSVNSIKTTGFNNFSKVRAANNIINDDGTLGTSYVYSVDTFKVLPNTVYYLKDVANGANTNTYAIYDSSMSLISIGKASIGSDLNVTTSIATPSNAAYMAIACHNDYLDTCCVNIRHTGVHDGEYKDYEEHILTIPEIAKHFPYGMQGIDDVYDEITPNGITKRLGVIPLNTLDWSYDSRSSCWRGTGIRYKVPLLALSNRYEINNVAATDLTEGQISCATGALLELKLSSVATVKDLYDTLDGAYIVYELYNEEHISLDSPLQLDYWVSDWGTEDAISEDVSTPFKADIVYAFNAEGRIRDNERNIERLEENLNQMVAPYIIKSFRAGDFTEYEDVLLMDISPDDLLGGAISQALRNNRPVYLKVGTTTAPMGGLCAMQYCYEDDFIYFSFLYEGLEFFGEIDNEQVRFAYRETRVDIPTEIATATPILRYGTADDIPESIAPNTLVLYEFSTNGNISLPMLTGGEEGFDNKWKIRVTSTSSDLITIPFSVAWKGNNPPYWDEYSMCEFTFFKEAGSIFGEWAVYQPY